MDFDSSSKFIASLAKFLQSLCNGYVEFDKGVEVIGHIYLSVDSNTGKKIDYVLNEKVCKNDNSVTFISNSFHAQPAEKPKLPKKSSDLDEQNDDSGGPDESGQMVPNSTNVGTIGGYRTPTRGNSQEQNYSPGSKRPRSPFNRRPNMGKGPSKLGIPQSPRYHNSGGSAAKMARSDVPPICSNDMTGGEEYDGSSVFHQGGEDDEPYSSNFLHPDEGQELDQKPVIDPDITIVKEEYLANQQISCAYSGNNQTSGPGRGKGPGHGPSSAYPVMLHPNPSSNYPSASSHPTDSYGGPSLDAADPSATCAPPTWSGLSRSLQLEESSYIYDVCDGTERTLVRCKDGLIRHMCGNCGNVYRRSYDLTRHQWKCLKKKSFICTGCDKEFFRSDKFKIHQLKCKGKKRKKIGNNFI